MRKTIYLAIIKQLRAAEIGIQHISLWNDNLSALESEQSFRLPAVFVEFDPMQYKQGGQGSKSSTARIRLHIVTEMLADPSDGSKYQNEALETFDLINSVVETISGMAGDGFNRLQHVETIPDHNHDEIQHDIEVFVCEASFLAKTPGRARTSEIRPKIIMT